MSLEQKDCRVFSRQVIHQRHFCFLDNSFKRRNGCHCNIKLADVHVPIRLIRIHQQRQGEEQLTVVVFSRPSIPLNGLLCVNRTCLRDAGFVIHLLFLGPIRPGLPSLLPSTHATHAVAVSLPNNFSLNPLLWSANTVFFTSPHGCARGSKWAGGLLNSGVRTDCAAGSHF